MNDKLPNRPAFCMFCGRDYRATLPFSDAPTPIIGPCCTTTEAAKRHRETVTRILGYMPCSSR